VMSRFGEDEPATLDPHLPRPASSLEGRKVHHASILPFLFLTICIHLHPFARFLDFFLTFLARFAFDLCAKIDGLHNSQGRVDPDSFLPPGLPDLRQYPASQQEAMMKDARMEVLKAVLG